MTRRPLRTSSTRPSLLPALFAAILFPIFASGCATAKAPRFESHSASVTDSTSTGVAFEFLLIATNDNDFGLPLRTLSYSLDIDGQTVFRGTRSAEATIRANGDQTVRLAASAPVESESADVSGLRRYVLTGTVTYVTPGAFAELLFDQGFRIPSAPFRIEGEIDIPRSAAAAPATADATR